MYAAPPILISPMVGDSPGVYSLGMGLIRMLTRVNKSGPNYMKVITAVVGLLIAAIQPVTAAVAEPINLRCANMSVSNPNPNVYYAFVTVDLDTKKIKMVTNYPGGSSAFDYDITQADDQRISALSFDQGLERRMVLDRLSGRIVGKINGRYGWVSSDFDCQPAKRVL